MEHRAYIVEMVDVDKTHPGGMRTYTLNLFKYLSKLNYEPILLGIGENKNVPNFIPLCKESGISAIEYVIRLFGVSIPNNSIVHAQLSLYAFPFVFPRKKNIVVVTLHGIDQEAIKRKRGKIIGWIYGLIEKFVLNRVDKIIVVSDEIRDYCIRKYPFLRDNVVVIPVGIDTKRFRYLDKQKMKQKHGFNESDEIILYVGRLRKEKGVDLLIKSFREVKNRIKDAKLVLVGDGKEKGKLIDLVRALELDDVVFMGTLEHDKIPEIMNCADVLALTSLYESGPLVVQEALACGVPVVSVDVGRVQEFIQNDSVGKVVGRDRGDIANAIIHFLGKEDHEAIKKVCREIALKFSFETTAKQTISVYKSVVCDSS